MLSAMAISQAQNPLVTHIYTADPTARVFDGKLYIYPSCDERPEDESKYKRGTGLNFCMPGYHSFTLVGGSTWQDNGWLLKENDAPWTQKDVKGMWAPDCIEKDGKYYYFFPANAADSNGAKKIGMGVSDSPTGPFKWQKSYIEGVAGIDPGLLLDDKDNKAYLFFGGGETLQVAPLSDDMTKITQKPIDIVGLPGGYKEGAFPIKIDDIYYLTFAHVFTGEGYTIGYATSKNPMGPYSYQGKIMDNINNGTNHHSLVKYQDRWILFYHSWQLSGTNKLRSMCADYVNIKKDYKGKTVIEKTKPTLRGIGAPMPGDTIQIDCYNTIEGAQRAFVTGGEPKGWMICETNTRSYVTFNDVDFADGSSTKMQARVASGQRAGVIEVHKDSVNGPLIAKFDIAYTGGWDKWITLESDILKPQKGKVNLCVVFKGANGDTKIANLNWLLIPKK